MVVVINLGRTVGVVVEGVSLLRLLALVRFRHLKMVRTLFGGMIANLTEVVSRFQILSLGTSNCLAALSLVGIPITPSIVFLDLSAEWEILLRVHLLSLRCPIVLEGWMGRLEILGRVSSLVLVLVDTCWVGGGVGLELLETSSVLLRLQGVVHLRELAIVNIVRHGCLH